MFNCSVCLTDVDEPLATVDVHCNFLCNNCVAVLRAIYDKVIFDLTVTGNCAACGRWLKADAKGAIYFCDDKINIYCAGDLALCELCPPSRYRHAASVYCISIQYMMRTKRKC